MMRLSVGVSGWGFSVFDPGKSIRQLPPMQEAGEEEDSEIQMVEDHEKDRVELLVLLPHPTH